jgi:enamine deaminase RidA (YjgF/YER057c/UK114 family)
VIERNIPQVDYVDLKVFEDLHFTQAIKAGNTLYLSGTAPFKGDIQEPVGVGDMRAQVEWTLEVIKRCLAAYGADFRNWVAQTVYTTDIEGLAKTTDIFGRYFGEHVPTTWIQVARLFHPDQMIEINGIAALE